MAAPTPVPDLQPGAEKATSAEADPLQRPVQQWGSHDWSLFLDSLLPQQPPPQ